MNALITQMLVAFFGALLGAIAGVVASVAIEPFNRHRADKDDLVEQIHQLLDELAKDGEEYWATSQSELAPARALIIQAHLVAGFRQLSQLLSELFGGRKDGNTLTEATEFLADLNTALTGGDFQDPAREASEEALKNIRITSLRMSRVVKRGRVTQFAFFSKR